MWDQPVQRELVNKPVCDFQAPLVHHLWGRKTSSSVLGKDAEPQVCVRGGAKGCACGRGGKGQDALQGDDKGMMSARNTLRVSGRHLASQQEAGCGGDSRHLSRAAGDSPVGWRSNSNNPNRRSGPLPGKGHFSAFVTCESQSHSLSCLTVTELTLNEQLYEVILVSSACPIMWLP